MTHLPLLATLVDFCGSVLIGVAAARCLWDFLHAGGGPADAEALRLRLAQALVSALSFKTGAGLIRTSTVTTLAQFRGLVVIVALRFLLGRVLKGQLARRQRPSGTSPAREAPS